MPRPGHTLQVVESSVGELDATAENKVLHGRGDQHLARFREAGHSCCDVDGQTGEVIVPTFTFAGVQTSSDANASATQSTNDCLATTNT
jgi:hypothetical protein